MNKKKQVNFYSFLPKLLWMRKCVEQFMLRGRRRVERIIPNQSRQGLHIHQARLHFVSTNLRRNSDLYVSSKIILCSVQTNARITQASPFALCIKICQLRLVCEFSDHPLLCCSVCTLYQPKNSERLQFPASYASYFPTPQFPVFFIV